MKKEFEKEQKDNQTDDAFLDMPDMEDDEKFRQWLNEEYLREADAIEEALFDGRKPEDRQDVAEKLSVSRESFYQRAREEGLLEDATDEPVAEETVSEPAEKKILEFGKKAAVSKDAAREEKRNPGKKKHSYVRLGRIAGIVGLCLICVFAASMSSEANRKYLVNSMRILSGNDSQLISYNDESNENASTKESDAIADIEEKLDVKMPEFYYRPYGMEFIMYEISEPTSIAYIKYGLNDTNVLFYIDKQQKNKASNISSINGKEKIVDIISKDWGNIVIKEVEDESDMQSTYSANWIFEGNSYTIAGKIKLKELKKILKEMKF